LYYRALGFIVVGSLVIAAAQLVILFLLLGEWIGFTLTLAAVAGAIVAIGITADSFIVYFERIRDEMREGKPLRVAAETGWQRARRTIIVADLVSIISAVILYIVSVGSVRGFAFTLGLTTLVDLVVIFLFTKPLVTLLAKNKYFQAGGKYSGVSPHSIGLVNQGLESKGA
jgi:preprotein translocase subunit SecD